jgi:hypothetical protein
LHPSRTAAWNSLFVFVHLRRVSFDYNFRYIFEFRFMRVQINRLYDEILLSDENESVKLEFWRSASLRFYSQSTLRAVSSISIAIKSCYFRLVNSILFSLTIFTF